MSGSTREYIQYKFDPLLHPLPPPLKFVRINDDDDGSENVTFKMNLHFFKLCRVYFNLLKMTNVGKFLLELNSWGPH